tara:strand:+ start:419 stop:1960 length:1542 start_codon:yes stop_codon:yes gene_type:complete
MRIVVGGNDFLAFETTKWLLKNKENVIAIFSENRGNSWEINFSSKALEITKELNIPFIQGNLNYYEDYLNELKPDIIFPFRCKNIINKNILDIPEKGCVHIHYGDLPKYAGGAPIASAILANEKYVVPTMQYMAEKVDSGDIISKIKVDISPGTRKVMLSESRELVINGLTSYEAYNKCNLMSLRLFKDTYYNLKEGRINPIKQNINDIEYKFLDEVDYGYDRLIDENESKKLTESKIKAFTFPPAQVPIIKIGNRYKDIVLYPNLESMAQEIADYRNESKSDIMKLYNEARSKYPGYVKWTYITENEWVNKKIDTSSSKSLKQFYSKTENYIFELMENWSIVHKNKMAHSVVTILKNHGVKKLLSYGTGIGQDVIYYYHAGMQVHAADIPGKTLEFAKWRFNQYCMDIGIIEISDDYPLKENYDAITVFEVFQHVIDPVKLAKHLYDHLHKNGLLIFTSKFENSYKLALKNNEKYSRTFLNELCAYGFKIVKKRGLWGKGDNKRYLYVLIKS